MEAKMLDPKPGTVTFPSKEEKKQLKKRFPRKKKVHSFKKMPKDDQEKEELRKEVVDHVNLTRNRTKTLKHFMAQGYANFMIRKMMGELFKNPNPEKKPFIIDADRKNTLKKELAAFMVENKLEKKDPSQQLKQLVKYFKQKGFSKGQVRSAHHQFVVRIARRGKPILVGKNKPAATKDGSPNGSDSGVENIEPSSSVSDHSEINSPKRKSTDNISPSPAKVSKMSPKAALTPKQNQTPKSLKKKSAKKNKAQTPTNTAVQVTPAPEAESNLSQESVTTPKEYPKTPEGYINRKTMRKMKRESFEAAKSGLTPKTPDQVNPSPFKESFTPAVASVDQSSLEKVSPVKASAIPIVVASPKLETSEHPNNGIKIESVVVIEEQKTRSPSPVKKSPVKQQTPMVKQGTPMVKQQSPMPNKQATPPQMKQVSAKKPTLKSSLKKKVGKSQVPNDDITDTPKEEKRVSFGKNQIKEFNKHQTPNVPKQIKKNRETDLIKFTPAKNLMSFETPAKQLQRSSNQTNDNNNKQDADDCPQLISVLDEPTPELKAPNGTPVEPMVPKKKKTPPKFSPRMTRSAAKKKVVTSK